MGLLTLAVEETAKLNFGEELRGYLIVIFAIGLFCGSIYLLLATNIGARLGFLVAFAAMTGFLCMLGLIWFANLTPLNALHGPPPHWVVKQVVSDPSKSKIKAVRDIVDKGNPIDATAQGEVKASVDTAVATEGSPFAKYTNAADYVVVKAVELGGGKRGLFAHKTRYAVMAVQGKKDVTPLPGSAPPPPTADPAKETNYIVLVRDLGALRLPPLVMSSSFGILFVISLVALHNVERANEAAKERGELEPKPAWA